MTGYLKNSPHYLKVPLVVTSDTVLHQPNLKTNENKSNQSVVHLKFLKVPLSSQDRNKVDLIRAFLKNKLNATDLEQETNVIDKKKAQLLIVKLPTKYRQVIQLRYGKVLSLKEVALITGQTQNAVAVQIHRGISKLKMLYFDT